MNEVILAEYIQLRVEHSRFKVKDAFPRALY